MADLKELLKGMVASVSPDAVKGIDATVQFNFTGDGGGSYNLVIKDGVLTPNEGAAVSPNVTMTIAVQDYLDIQSGKLNPMMAFMSQKLKIAGDLGLAMKLQALLKRS